MLGPIWSFSREAIMSKIAIFFVAIFASCVLANAAEPAPKSQDSKDVQIKALQAQVRQQEAIIRDLSEKLAQAQAKPPLTLKFVPPQIMQAMPKLAPQQMPQGWVRREFNGSALYLIPLAGKNQ